MTPVTDGNDGAEGTARRPLLKLAAGGAALASVGVAVRLTLHSDGDRPGDQEGALVLSTQPGSDVSTLQVALGDDLLPQQGRRRWESRRLPTSVHSMVAFTWGVDEEAPVVRIRSRTGSGWGSWQLVPHLHDLPDELDADSDARIAGTDLVWIGRADGVQVRVDGDRPSDLTLVLLHPARRATDPLVSAFTSARAAAQEETQRVPEPKLVTRGDWGANENLRDGRPSFNDTLRQVHIHHTVNSNDYARDDVPALIRGMYAYHTQSLGWSDIGYNFLVDRFGRAFVGRFGGPARLVRGAHTLGFNATSTGISVIGNYETARPTKAALDMIAQVAAWKLAPFDRNPRGKLKVTSEGSDRFGAGRVVELPVIDGHRDTNDTACPGQHLYDALPSIRKRTARKIRAARQTSIVVERPARVVGTPRLGATLRAEPGRFTPEGATVAYRWLRGEREIRGAREQAYVVRPWDVGKALTCRVVLRATGFDPVTQTPDPLPPATADPALTLAAGERKRVVTVQVAVTAPEAVRQTPTGRVTVWVGERSRSVRLTDGRAVVRFGRHRKLPVGRYAVRASYDGVEPFTSTEATGGTVRVG